MTTTTQRIRALLDEIDTLESERNRGASAWQDGSDPFAMAECDPSDQFLISEELQELWSQVSTLVKSHVE